MKIATRYHNEVEIEDKQIWTFTYGLPGFSAENKYVILPLSENPTFSILQSIQSPEFAFVIANPFTFFSDYELKIDEQSLEQLEIIDEKDVIVMTILTIHDSLEKSTANLQAPIIFNETNRNSKQIILNDSRYSTKHPLFSQTIGKVKR